MNISPKINQRFCGKREEGNTRKREVFENPQVDAEGDTRKREFWKVRKLTRMV